MKTCIVFAVSILLSGKVAAQNIPQRLYNYLTAAAADNGMNGNILLAKDGRVVYKESFGYIDFSSKTPNTDATLFPLASISKTFTSVAVLQLKEKGKLKLDDKLVKYLPEFPYPTITIRQLLSHTSGLPDSDAILDSLVAANPHKIFTNADDIPALKIYQSHHQLPFQPGERWSYSSTGYQLLAQLVEKLSGEPFDVYLRQHIFLPAGMTSSYLQTSLSQTKEANRTSNYQFNNHYEMKLELMDTVRDKREWTYNLTGSFGAGNIVSTTGDLLKYDEALYTGVLLKPATLDEAFTPVKLNNGQNNQAVAGTSGGLGWFIYNDESNGKIVWHSGSNPGVTTLFVRNITEKETYIVLQNVACPNPVYHGMLDIINGKPIVYKKSAGFAYGADLYNKGIDYAMAHLNQMRADTANYTLTEADIDRMGLEFSRTKYQNLSLEAYKVNTLFFPNSWNAYANYAAVLSRNPKNKDASILLYQQVLGLNPGNPDAKRKLDALLKK